MNRIPPNCTELVQTQKSLTKARQIPQYMGAMTGLTPKYGTPGAIRTHNLLIRSQALYPLSYGGILIKGSHLNSQIIPRLYGCAKFFPLDIHWVGKL
jgi:hypothetical protein